MERVFVGWEGALLAKAAQWLASEFGSDLHGVVVALPGARSGRILQELLARELGAELQPPKVVTAGGLSDELLDVRGISAGRLVRTLAWQRALEELPREELLKIVARPPSDGDTASWSRLAEEVRGLFGELAAEGLDFAAVAESSMLDELASERGRWQALGQAQARMAQRLDQAGLHDPHLGRLAAIEAQAVCAPRQVVLIGVVEMNELLRRSLELCSSKQVALIFAPEVHAASFDELGCLVPTTWCSYETSLAIKQWRVVDRPVDQAHEAARIIASWGGKYRAEQVTVGLADAQVSPYLKNRLAEVEVRGRDAAGVSIARTPAVKLLAAVGEFLGSRSFRALSSLTRHPDFEWALLRGGLEAEPIEVLDEYHEAHLPWRADGGWLADDAESRDLALRAKMSAVWKATQETLGEVLDTGARSIAQQTSALRDLLERIYGNRELDAGKETDRVLIASLRCLATALTELDELPPSLAPEGSFQETIDLVLRVASNKSNDIAPSAARKGEATIEMMGWLELPLDDAPALVVTGFEDGKVPESVRGDAYLPNRLRHDLGLVDNEQRLARDVYATELLLQSRESIVFISGRRSLQGDPQVPSRVVFHCPEDQVAERVRLFLSAASAPAAERTSTEVPQRELPRLAEQPVPETISVSAFKTFLSSPYAYYLRHVLKVETIDDHSREMSGAAFGNLAHAVLQRFGQDERAREERDAKKIASFLVDELHALGEKVYGKRPLPAVQLQLEQLALRLRVFADRQAARRGQGWRIHAVEWKPTDGGVPLVVDGEAIQLRGKIDRIDRHETSGEWAIWDYKTGDKANKPLNAHRRQDGSWRDLQLPLYCLLVPELLDDAQPTELGYISIGSDEKNSGFLCIKDWRRSKGECDSSEEAMLTGLEAAHDVVRRIRARDWFELGDWKPYDPIFEAIGGAGLVASSGATLDSDEEGAL